MSAATTANPDALKNGSTSHDGTAAEWVATDSLHAWSKNPRKNDGEPVRKVAESIKRFGFGAPIIARRENGEIIAGHTRWKAAKKLGMATVPVRFLDLDEGSAHLLAIADNRVGEEAEWDAPMLAAALAEMNATAEMVEATGFDAPELKKLLGSTPVIGDVDAEPQTGRAEALREKWGVVAGQLWQLGEHRLLCGDCTKPEDVDRVMGGQKAAVCLTDPPYGLGAKKASGKNSYDVYDDSRSSLEALASKWLPIAREVATVVCFSPGVTNAWIYPEASWIMCWFYGGGQLRSSWGFNCWQPFLCYGKDPSLGSGNGGRPDAVDMNTPANGASIDHPCPKPTALWVWFIERLSFNRDDLFYEPFCGSGTTIIACEQLGRKCRAIEISPGYVAVTLQRFEDATGKKPTLVGA